MKILSYIHMLIIVVALSLPAFGQGDRALSLSETVDLAIQQNWTVMKSEKQLEIAKGDLAQSNSTFLPAVSISENFTTTTDPLMVFGIKLKQEITEISDFDPDLLNNPERIENFNTRIEVNQPLLNLDGIWARKAASAAAGASEKELEWTKQMIRLKSKSLYYQLYLSHRIKETVNESQKAAFANSEMASHLFDQGLITRSDLLAAELRNTELESQLIAAENNIVENNLELVHFLRLEPGTRVIPVDDIQIEGLNTEFLDDQKVPESRSDLRAMALQVEASEYSLKSSRQSNLPRLNLMGAYEWNDPSFLGTNANNYLVGASLRWDILSGGKRSGKVQKAEAQNSIAELQYEEKLSQSQNEIEKLMNNIVFQKKQLELSELAVEQATESYDIISDRYEEGLETTADLLHSESNLFQQKLNLITNQNYLQQMIFTMETLLEETIVTP